MAHIFSVAVVNLIISLPLSLSVSLSLCLSFPPSFPLSLVSVCLRLSPILHFSRIQEKLPPQPQEQEDQQVYVRVPEERAVRHGRRAHLRGGRPLLSAQRS